jgi:hypothetical protein
MMKVSDALLARTTGGVLLGLGFISWILAIHFWPFYPYAPFAIIFLSFGTATYLWGLGYRKSLLPGSLVSALVVTSEVAGSFLLLLALYENSVVYIFTGVTAANVSSAAVLVPLVLGVVLWIFAIVLDRAFFRRRSERARIEGKTPSGRVPPSGTSPTFTRDPEDDARIRRMYHEITQAVRSLHEVAQPLVRQAVILVTVVLALLGLLVLGSVRSGGAPDGLATLVAYSAAAVAILYVFAWAWLGWLGRIRRDLGSERVPVEPYPSWTPLFRRAREAHSSSQRQIGVQPVQEDSSILTRSFSLLGLGRRLEELAHQSMVWIFLGVLLVGSVVGYSLAWSVLVWMFGLSPPFTNLNLYDGVAWLTAGVIATLSFLLLHRKYRPIVRADRVLTSLELEEIELERAFWSRF